MLFPPKFFCDYKYFAFAEEVCGIEAELRGTAKGTLYVYTDLTMEPVGSILVDLQSSGWKQASGKCSLKGEHVPVYFKFEGDGEMDFRSFIFKKSEL